MLNMIIHKEVHLVVSININQGFLFRSQLMMEKTLLLVIESCACTRTNSKKDKKSELGTSCQCLACFQVPRVFSDASHASHVCLACLAGLLARTLCIPHCAQAYRQQIQNCTGVFLTLNQVVKHKLSRFNLQCRTDYLFEDCPFEDREL